MILWFCDSSRITWRIFSTYTELVLYAWVLPSNHMTSSKREDSLICHTTMRRNLINFLYNSGHVTLWCVEVGPLANARESSTQEHDCVCNMWWYSNKIYACFCLWQLTILEYVLVLFVTSDLTYWHIYLFVTCDYIQTFTCFVCDIWLFWNKYLFCL